MLYNVMLDTNGYVINIVHTNTRADFVELNLEDYDFSEGRMNAYKLGKDKLVFDEERYNDIQNRKTRNNNAKEIVELKQKLTDSDYIVARAFEEVMALKNPLTWVADVLVITLKYSRKYAETIANRSLWRKRIEELENKATKK